MIGLETSAIARANVDFTLTLSDKTKKKGKFKEGKAKVEDIPYGKFTIEIEGHEFVFKE